jgi:hypothetical protein
MTHVLFSYQVKTILVLYINRIRGTSNHTFSRQLIVSYCVTYGALDARNPFFPLRYANLQINGPNEYLFLLFDLSLPYFCVDLCSLIYIFLIFFRSGLK